MPDGLFQRFRCPSCLAGFDLVPISSPCPECGKGSIEAVYDLSRFALPESPVEGVWRYGELLPFNEPAVTLDEGGTPLIHCSRIEGFAHLYVKDESRNPTSSFADRGSTVAVSAAVRFGASKVACASDGDTGASVAAYSSKAGLECTVFAPHNAETGKLLQTLVYGAKLIRTHGTFRNSLMRCEAGCRSWRCQNLTIETSPYAIEGEKTTGFEIAEQLDWRAPDFLVVPVGTGTNLHAIWKGYTELLGAGVVDEVPRMVGVQASACAPVVNAFVEGGGMQRMGTKKSVAASIAVGDPPNGEAALRALRDSRGAAYSYSDEEITEAVSMLGSREGVFAEPSSAATICAAESLIDEGMAERSDIIVCVITGSGLKVPDSIAQNLKPKLTARWDLPNATRNNLGPIGQTKAQVLEVLEPASNYGYSIWRQLETRFDERMSLQAVYQHLDDLSEMGLVEAVASTSRRSGGRKRKYYSLTSRGRRVVRSLNEMRDETP